MALTNPNALLKLAQLEIVKSYIDQEDAKSIHSVYRVGNKVNFYKEQTPTTTGADATTPAFSWDIPAEMVLDTTKTAFYPNFNHAEAGLPAELAAWTSLDGKPVLALGVKTVDASGTETFAYSPVNLEKLVDTYVGSDSIEIDETGENPAIKAKLSAKSGNILTILEADGEKGLYVPPVVADGNKADKLAATPEGNRKEDQILVDDGNGNIKASGKTIAEVKTELIGAANATKTTDTINGAKAYANDAADAVLGTNADDKDDDTVFGAKAFATAEKEAVIGDADNDTKDSLTLNGLKKLIADKTSALNFAEDSEVAGIFGITLS